MASKRSEPPRKQPLVLVVDDEADQRELYGQFLRDAGYAVETAPDGATAITRAHQLAPDAIVMDHQMPLVDGMTATARLRASAVTQAIPIVVLTASTEHPLVVRAVEAGADAFLGKPCTPQALLAAVEKAIFDARKRAVTLSPRR